MHARSETMHAWTEATPCMHCHAYIKQEVCMRLLRCMPEMADSGRSSLLCPPQVDALSSVIAGGFSPAREWAVSA